MSALPAVLRFKNSRNLPGLFSMVTGALLLIPAPTKLKSGRLLENVYGRGLIVQPPTANEGSPLMSILIIGAKPKVAVPDGNVAGVQLAGIR